MLPQEKPILGIHKIELFSANIWNGNAKQLVQMQITRMAEATSFDNTLVAGLALVPRFASAATGSCGPRPWHGFTHGPQPTAKFP